MAKQEGENKAYLQSMLCPETLLRSFREAHAVDQRSREGLKELLYPATHSHPSLFPQRTKDAPAAENSSEQWLHCLQLLREDFLARKQELLRLNKARRQQIETSLRKLKGLKSSLEDFVHAKIGSPEEESLQDFALATCIFHLLQILLAKRLVDRKLLQDKSFSLSAQASPSFNSKILEFLRSRSRQGLLHLQDWSFLKQNIYSWFTPSKDTWERIRLHLLSHSLEGAPDNHLLDVLKSLGGANCPGDIGIRQNALSCRFHWSLLLELRRIDLGIPSIENLASTSDPNQAILVSGLMAGESLSALAEFEADRKLEGVRAYSDKDFERYLTEIGLLWNCSKKLPQVKIFPHQSATEKDSLFHGGALSAQSAPLAAIFDDGCGRIEEDCSRFLDRMKENGLLLLVTDSFWPTDASDASATVRAKVLQKASVRYIIDLRSVHAGAKSLPKGIFLLEKCSSKEIRDANRPKYIRIKGALPADLSALLSAILPAFTLDFHPGEVQELPLGKSSGLKIECMSAATTQLHLKTAPWLTLTESIFYQISSQLRRHTYKAFMLGNMLQIRGNQEQTYSKAVYCTELHGTAVQAALQSSDLSPEGHGQTLFLLDSNTLEHPRFFSAQINSAPLRFWYRLEHEQETNRPKIGSKAQDRQRLALLKMMPMVRLFDGVNCLQAGGGGSPLVSSQEALIRELKSMPFAGELKLQQRVRLHQIVLDLDHTIEQHLELTRGLFQYLFPDRPLYRWNLPQHLPEIEPLVALSVLHLDKIPVYNHPALHFTRLKPGQDFRVTDLQIQETSGRYCELSLFGGIDPVLKISGPGLFVHAIATELKKRLNRPWQESAMKILLPADIQQVNASLHEIRSMVESKLSETRKSIEIMDKIFCCLFGLSESMQDDSAYREICKHLNPEESRLDLSLLPPKGSSAFLIPRDFEAARGLLQ